MVASRRPAAAGRRRSGAARGGRRRPTRPSSRSTALHASSSASGPSAVSIRRQALRKSGWSSTCADRLGVVDRRRGEHVDAASGQRGDGRLEVRPPVADVRAEAEVALESRRQLPDRGRAGATGRSARRRASTARRPPPTRRPPRAGSRSGTRTWSSGAIPAGGSGRRMWIVRSSVGATTKRPIAANAAGAQASVIAATSGASSVRGAARPEPAARAGAPRRAGAAPSACRSCA